jgi:hypothetical protein
LSAWSQGRRRRGSATPSLSSLLPFLRVFLRGDRGGGVLVSGGRIRPGPRRIRGLGRRMCPLGPGGARGDGDGALRLRRRVRPGSGNGRGLRAGRHRSAAMPSPCGRDGCVPLRFASAGTAPPGSGGGAPQLRWFDGLGRRGGASLVSAVCLPRQPLHGLGGRWWLPWPARSWEVGMLGMEMCWWHHGGAAGPPWVCASGVAGDDLGSAHQRRLEA